MRLAQGYASMHVEVVRLNRRLYGLKQAFHLWHGHLTTRMKSRGFEQCLTDACVLHMIEEGQISFIAVVHVDGIFVVGGKSRCHRFCKYRVKLYPRTG